MHIDLIFRMHECVQCVDVCCGLYLHVVLRGKVFRQGDISETHIALIIEHPKFLVANRTS